MVQRRMPLQNKPGITSKYSVYVPANKASVWEHIQYKNLFEFINQHEKNHGIHYTTVLYMYMYM